MRVSEIAMTAFIVATILACLSGPYVISIILMIALAGAVVARRHDSLPG